MNRDAAMRIERFKKRLQISMATSATLLAAEELGVFVLAQEKPRTSDQLARACGTSRRVMKSLTNALVTTGALTRDGARLRLSVAVMLLQARRLRLGSGSSSLRGVWSSWRELFRQQPGRSKEQRRRGNVIGSEYSAGLEVLHSVSWPAARACARRLDAGLRRDCSVLDVGAGSGVWSAAVAERLPRARVTLLDRRDVLVALRQLPTARPEGRVEYKAGDMFRLPWGSSTYDLIIIGNVFHLFSPQQNARLLTKAQCALRAQGQLVIVDVLRPESSRISHEINCYALDLTLRTRGGGVYSFSSLRQWLVAAGFSKVRQCALPRTSESVSMVTARR
jgi:ubiquinone/menaquinone biosynthesis C-methylase UbiE